MSLSDLASLGSFVSGIAVLISLVYVALQVRQAERNQRALMQQGRAGLTSAHLDHMADPEVSSAFVKVLSGDPATTYAEHQQFALIFRASLYLFEDAFFQHQRGLLDDASFQSTRGTLTAIFSLPAYRVQWRRTRHFQEETFRNFLDGIIRDTPIQPISDQATFMANWHRDFAAELRPA